jgi:hypothetical protein
MHVSLLYLISYIESLLYAYMSMHVSLLYSVSYIEFLFYTVSVSILY